jgi:hypothetical protein
MDALEALLQETGLRYRRNDRHFSLVFETSTYRAPDGGQTCAIAVEPFEDGAFLGIFAPDAFTARGPHVQTVLRACLLVQRRTRVVRFCFYETTGEIRPSVEVPLHDAALTAGQLTGCIKGLMQVIEECAPTLRRALHDGVIGFTPSHVIESDVTGMIADELWKSGEPAALETARQLLAPEDSTAPGPDPRIDPSGA